MVGIGTTDAPLRVAIVGSGPSGFYAADHLLRNTEVACEVDMIDRLPTPYGLVRGGVAPDHPKIKSVTRVYDKTATLPGFRFFGNVELGRDIHRADLRTRYHAIVYAVGAQSDRRMGIPGEDLPGSAPATEFVGWYNGHPDYRDLEFDLSTDRAVVVGNGNVAMDVARMLALPADELGATDVADHALEALRGAAVEEIVVLGRRGPAQAAFTNPEIRELGQLPGVDVLVDPADLEMDEASLAEIEGDRRAQKNLEILREIAEKPPQGNPRRIVLRFYRSPIEIHGADRVEAVSVCRNAIERDATGTPRARQTDEVERLPCGLVLRSIGYRGSPLPELPFDENRGVMPNEGGRLLDRPGGPPAAGEYVVGWIKRGPTGIIGTNKRDAQQTVDTLLGDLDSGRLPEPAESEGIERPLVDRGVDAVTFAGWERIDRHEKQLGEAQGRPRIKLTTVREMVDLATAEEAASAS